MAAVAMPLSHRFPDGESCADVFDRITIFEVRSVCVALTVALTEALWMPEWHTLRYINMPGIYSRVPHLSCTVGG
jgi:hypothetical protein